MIFKVFFIQKQKSQKFIIFIYYNRDDNKQQQKNQYSCFV